MVLSGRDVRFGALPRAVRDPSTAGFAELGVLAVVDLHYAYHRGGEELYGGLTHTFPRGALTAVTGPSGRGKSTLLYLLGLLLRPVCGSVVLDGKRVDDRHDSVRSRIRATRFGFVFQDSVLDLTRPVVDSVIEPARYAGQTRPQAYPRALELLDLVGVGERAGHRPGQISGGQGQRVAIARALMNDPDIVLADEPTGNLDPDNSGAVLDALADSARSGCTVILATHDPVVIERVDTLLEL